MATTTLKAKMLSYRNVGATSGQYNPVAGVLKGLTITQDEPESTSIDAEFSDSPFYIEYTGNPVTINFELANYTLSQLTDLFGGTLSSNIYEAPTQITSVEKQWKLDFGVGFESLIIFKGQLVGTLKKDEDGALNYACSITSLMETYTSGSTTKYRTYAIVGPDQSTGGTAGSRVSGSVLSVAGGLPHTFTDTTTTVAATLDQGQMVSIDQFSTLTPVGTIVGNAKIDGNTYDLVVSAVTTSKVTIKDNVLVPKIQIELAGSTVAGTIKSLTAANTSASANVVLESLHLINFSDYSAQS